MPSSKSIHFPKVRSKQMIQEGTLPCKSNHNHFKISPKHMDPEEAKAFALHTTTLRTHDRDNRIRKTTFLQFNLLDKMINPGDIKGTISINKLSRASGICNLQYNKEEIKSDPLYK